jgi:hypothetical protein
MHHCATAHPFRPCIFNACTRAPAVKASMRARHENALRTRSLSRGLVAATQVWQQPHDRRKEPLMS